MNAPSLSQRWYVPAEIAALRVWLPFAAMVNLVIFGGEALREDRESQLIVLAGILERHLPQLGRVVDEVGLGPALEVVGRRLGRVRLGR